MILFSKVKWNIQGNLIKDLTFRIGDYSEIIVGKNAKLILGKNSGLGRHNRLTCLERVEIGDNTIVGQCVSIMDSKHNTELNGTPYKNQGYETKPTIIGNNVWIGANCVILYGIKIGDNAIIGANSVVRTNVPKNTLYAGCPAIFKRKLDE
jgi:acetyltransferase-like isoleucine patch superfamily enzyme